MAQITDPHLTAILSVILTRLNTDPVLVQDFRDTFGESLIVPVQELVPYDIGTGRVVFGGNTRFPALAIWRQQDLWSQFTSEARSCTATCGVKYILPANNDTGKMWAVLQRVTAEIDALLQRAVSDEADWPLLDAAGIVEWDVRFTSRYGYDGIDGQTLYPTATGTFTFKHESIFDSSGLPELLELYLNHNLKGAFSDGDLPPAFNPLVQQILLF